MPDASRLGSHLPPPTTARGDVDRLMAAVYRELRRLARHQRRHHGAQATLNTTALVHEAYLRLAEGDPTWSDRAHFMAIAARAMRFVIVDYARRAQAQKRGGQADLVSLSLDGVDAVARQQSADAMLDVQAALEKMYDVAPRMAQGVECRFFGGMAPKEIAHVLGCSERTVHRDWRRARLLLHRALDADPSGGASPDGASPDGTSPRV